MNRRDFIKAGAVAMVAANFAPGLLVNGWAADSVKKVSLRECTNMTAQEMAAGSAMLNKAYTYLGHAVSQIKNTSLKAIGNNYLTNPAPTLLERVSSPADKDRVVKALVDAKYLASNITAAQLFPAGKSSQASQPVLSTPGSGYQSHHAYPGGLVTHLAANVSIAGNITSVYQNIYNYDVNADIVILAQLLHDFHKPWVFQWTDSGESLPEITLAGQGAHHVLSIAQALYSNFDPALIVAMACAHAPNASAGEREQIISWIKAAGIIAGVDPVSYGVLGRNNNFPLGDRQEGYITHLGDHDWVLSVPAASNMIATLKKIAQEQYRMSNADLTGKSFNSFRNYVFSQVSIMRLHNIWANEGQKGVAELLTQIVSV